MALDWGPVAIPNPLSSMSLLTGFTRSEKASMSSASKVEIYVSTAIEKAL